MSNSTNTNKSAPANNPAIVSKPPAASKTPAQPKPAKRSKMGPWFWSALSVLTSKALWLTAIMSPAIVGVSQCSYQHPELEPLSENAIRTGWRNTKHNYKSVWNSTAQPVLNTIGALSTPGTVAPKKAASQVVTCYPNDSYKVTSPKERFKGLAGASYQERANRFYLNQENQIRQQFNDHDSKAWRIINNGRFAIMTVPDFDTVSAQGFGLTKLEVKSVPRLQDPPCKYYETPDIQNWNTLKNK